MTEDEVTQAEAIVARITDMCAGKVPFHVFAYAVRSMNYMVENTHGQRQNPQTTEALRLADERAAKVWPKS